MLFELQITKVFLHYKQPRKGFGNKDIELLLSSSKAQRYHRSL